MLKLIILAIIYCLLTGCIEEKTPAMLSPIMKEAGEKTYVICSPLVGVLMNNGKTLANTKIIRELKWNTKESSLFQEFFTDSEGRFELPIHQETFKMESVLTQFVANQYLSVIVENETHEIWISSQQSGEIHAETGGKEIGTVSCDLSNEYVPVYGEGIKLLSTSCRWENINLEYNEDE